MTRKSASIIPVALMGAALAFPAGAGAASLEDGVKAVKGHTSRADKALDRAVSLYGRNRDPQADKSFGLSRKEIAKAQRVAGKVARKARDARGRAAAARAQALVAEQQDENIEQLVGILEEAEGRVESKIAQAALSDTQGRDKALAVLSALLDKGVPSRAHAGVTGAMTALSTGRGHEVEVEAEALVSGEVAETSKDEVASAVEANVEGQQVAGARLLELISSPDTPDATKVGLQTAYDAVTAEQRSAGETLVRFSDRIPAAFRALVEQVATQARQSGESMDTSRPAPQPGPGSRPGA